MARTPPVGAHWAGGSQHKISNTVHGMQHRNSNDDGASIRASGDYRWRELYPLPLCEPVPRISGSSTSSRRRRAKVRDTVDKVISVIRTLNEMYAPSRKGDFSFSCPTKHN